MTILADMIERIRKKDWFDSRVADENRIGNDVLLMKRDDYWITGNEPFLADATTAIFLTRGQANVSINMNDYTVSAPCMILYMEGMVVRQGALSDDAKMDVFILSKNFSNEVLSESNVYGQLRTRIQREPVFPLSGRGKVTFAFYYLLMNLVSLQDAPYRLESVKHMALTLFYGFALCSPEEESKKVLSRSEVISERFLDLVKENYREQRVVAFYADKLCITPKYLSLSVKEATGKPALEWIDEYVSAEAKALLRSTDMTIDQIGEYLNFMSQSLFGKYFKRVTGMSPREYRYSNL